MDRVYGVRPGLAAGYERYAGKCGFPARALMGTLNQAGVRSQWVARNPHTVTLAAIASKQEKPEDLLKQLAGLHFG